MRPILEYASCVWSPHTITLINRLESVQRKFTKRLPGLRSFNYRTRLVKLNLESLEKRRLYQDLITTYKMLFGLYDIPNTSLFKLSRNDHNTRGHVYKLQLNHCRIDTRKFFFAERVVKQWNSIWLQLLMTFASLRTFKSLMMRTDFSQFLSIWCSNSFMFLCLSWCLLEQCLPWHLSFMYRLSTILVLTNCTMRR